MKNAAVKIRPRTISNAALLVGASLLLGLVRVGVDHTNAFSKSPLWFILPVMAITIGVAVLVTYLWYIGKNWARITFAVMYGIGFAISILQFDQYPKTFERSIVAGCISVAQTILQMVAVALVFTPSANNWFKKP